MSIYLRSNLNKIERSFNSFAVRKVNSYKSTLVTLVIRKLSSSSLIKETLQIKKYIYNVHQSLPELWTKSIWSCSLVSAHLCCTNKLEFHMDLSVIKTWIFAQRIKRKDFLIENGDWTKSNAHWSFNTVKDVTFPMSGTYSHQLWT